VYRPGPRRRRPRTWEKSGSSDVGYCALGSHGRTIGLSTYVWAFGHIALASDAAALSKPNGNALLGSNSPCGSNLAVGESARGASPPVVVRSSWRRAIMPTVSARGAVGSHVTSRLARTVGRVEAEGQRWCCPRLFLGVEAWCRGRLGALCRVGATRALPGPLIESKIMS
jgi:hypothetical protein